VVIKGFIGCYTFVVSLAIILGARHIFDYWN